MYDLDTVMLWAIFLTAILYGSHVTLFILQLYVLAYKRVGRQNNIFLFVVSLFQFACETTVLGLAFTRTLAGFINSGGGDGGALYFAELSLPVYLAQSSVQAVHIALGDALLIYRCWIVWNRRIIFVSLNILLWLASIVIVVLNIHSVSQVTLADVQTLVTVDMFEAAWLGLVLSQTILTTSMIVLRIWMVYLARSRPEERIFRTVATIILESGSLYVGTLIAYAVTVRVEAGVLSNILSNLANSMLGISFSLVIVRIGLGMSDMSGLPTTQGLSETSQWPAFTVSLANPREDVEKAQGEGKRPALSDTAHAAAVPST